MMLEALLPLEVVLDRAVSFTPSDGIDVDVSQHICRRVDLP